MDRRRAALGQPGGPTARRRVVPLVVAGLAVLVLVWFLTVLFEPFKGGGSGRVAVVVPRGASVGQIADILSRKGVISSAFFFRANATVTGRRGNLKAGTFTLKKDMSYGAALDALGRSPSADVVRVVVPEGRSRREVAAIVGKRLQGSYLGLTRRSPLIVPRAYGARRISSLEGFLFPATYELKPRSSTLTLVNEQLRTFKRQIRGVSMRYARSKNLTVYDVLIIASMVEREALLARERPIVASVIYNRLSRGIPLGIDATIRFATNNWTKPLTQSQLALRSPYNTRLRQGLPPGPIGSPGLSSLRAAARPARTGYLYYVVKPCGNGEHAFSRTDAQFQRDVQRYDAARSRRGGRSPAKC